MRLCVTDKDGENAGMQKTVVPYEGPQEMHVTISGVQAWQDRDDMLRQGDFNAGG